MEQNPNIKRSPNLTEGTIIWRYLSLDKFVYLVVEKALYFGSILNLPDKYEGSLSFGYKNFFASYTINGGSSSRSTPLRKQREQNINQKEEVIKFLPQTVVSCWTKYKTENYALWKTYTESASGIAIKSTVGILEASIEPNDYIINIFPVHYEQNDKHDLESLRTQKKEFYISDNEVRLFIASEKTHLKIPINPNKLITEIYLSPFMPPLDKKAAKELIESLSLDLFDKIKESSIKIR